MKKSLIALVALLVVGAASAQSTANGQASGRISTQGGVYASVSGAGASLSHMDSTTSAATVLAGAVAPGSASASVYAGGATTGAAYNTAIGAGSGSAYLNNWTDASGAVGVTISSPTGGVLVGAGSVDGGMTNAVRNGVDVHINAGTAQDGFANGSYSGSVALAGVLAGGTGSVASSQASDGSVAVGGITFTGGTPAGQTAAYREANTGAETAATGSYTFNGVLLAN